MQTVIEHLMDFLTNHRSSEYKAYLWSVGSSWASSRTTTGRAATPDRAPDVAAHRLKHHLDRHLVPEWVGQQACLHAYPKEQMLRNHV